MPVLESNLMILLAAAAVLLIVGAIAKALWRPVLRRVWLYFVAWWERDARAEREANLMQRARVQAEAEVHSSLCEEEPQAVPCAPPENSSTNGVPTMNDLERSENARPIRPVLTEEKKRILRN